MRKKESKHFQKLYETIELIYIYEIIATILLFSMNRVLN